MIITEPLTINEKSFTRTYSDSGFYIERDGVQYREAIDPSELGRTYTETDEPIDSGEEQTEIEQKAEAYDYLTGRTESEVESNE